MTAWALLHAASVSMYHIQKTRIAQGQLEQASHLQDDKVPVLCACWAQGLVVKGARCVCFGQMLAEEFIWFGNLHGLDGCVRELLTQQMCYNLHDTGNGHYALCEDGMLQDPVRFLRSLVIS